MRRDLLIKLYYGDAGSSGDETNPGASAQVRQATYVCIKKEGPPLEHFPQNDSIERLMRLSNWEGNRSIDEWHRRAIPALHVPLFH